MVNQKITYDLPFILLCLITVIGSLKPEFIIPSLKSIPIIRQIPNLLMGSLFLLWLMQGEKVFHNKQTKLYLAFFLLMLVDTILARNQFRAYLITKGFSIGIMGYLATVSFVDSFDKLNKLIKIFLFCNIFIAILGIKEGGLIKNIPALGDENDFALLMNILIPFAYFYGMEGEELKNKLFYFGATGLFVCGVVVSFSRGGFIGLIGSLLYCFYKTEKKLIVFLCALLIAVSALLFSPKAYWDEIATIQEGTQESTAATRIYLWENAMKIFANHPILGVGPLNSAVWVTTYDRSEQGSRDWGRALHSLYFTLLSELGLLGTFLFVSMIYYGERDKKYIIDRHKKCSSQFNKIKKTAAEKKALLNQFRKSSYLCFAFTGGLIGYMVSGIFLSVLYYGYWGTLMMYTVILYNITQKAVEENPWLKEISVINGDTQS